ncbi:MAG: helix-turn-helix domain-containing protein [Pseudomonadales bacterium]|nr:helix-turn-helix domain-containing protein [Pseudomonadales bacterium]
MYTQANTAAAAKVKIKAGFGLDKCNKLQELPCSTRGSFKQNCNCCSMHIVCLAKSVGEESRQVLNGFIQHPRPLRKGEHFYRQNDDFVALYVVNSGAVKTYFINQQGEEYITGMYLPGELFGVDGMDIGRHRYSAKALDTSSICEFGYSNLEQSCQSFPDIQRRLTEILCAEIFQKQQPLLSMRQNSAEQRLATFLTDLSARLQSSGLSATEFNLPLSRRDIASYLGLVEETMSRTFSRLQKRQIVRVSSRSVIITDLPALQALSMNRC